MQIIFSKNGGGARIFFSVKMKISKSTIPSKIALSDKA
jgi:hypothetical protein